MGTDSEVDCEPLSGTVAGIGVGGVESRAAASLAKACSDDAALSAFRFVIERPACSVSPASLASNPRDAGRDTTFCGRGGIIVTTLSFQGSALSLPTTPFNSTACDDR